MRLTLTAVTAVGLMLPSPPAKSGPGPESPGARYRAILRDYEASQRRLDEALRKAKTPQEEADLWQQKKNPKEFARRFVELARESPKGPAAVEALFWALQHGRMEGPEVEEALDLLARDHLRSKRLGPICVALDRLCGDWFPPAEKLFRAVLRESPHREARGAACLALADQMRLRHDSAAAALLLGRASRTGLRAKKVAAWGEEAAELYRQVIARYGDLPADPDKEIGARTLADTAKAGLDELLHLAPGKVAPDIEGEDLDGKKFKLSDYRGKVVVLDFWSHRLCPICRAMYPEQRALVKRLGGKPFALLGVNVLDRRDELKGLVARGEITWRFWYEGGDKYGPIASRWHAWGFPTIYVIDPRGVIRAKGQRGGDIERTVSRLLEEPVR